MDKRFLQEALKEEPGIMSFAYPHARSWEPINPKIIEERWRNSAGDAILYIHSPYCFSKCGYCGFYSVPLSSDSRTAQDQTVRSILKEAKRYADYFKGKIKAVDIGGGTPNALAPAAFALLTDVIELFKLDNTCESSVELYPVSDIDDYLEICEYTRINRVSIGIQDFNDEVLRVCTRKHTTSDALNAYDLTRRRFGNINLDLMLGLPRQTLKSWEKTIDILLELHPENATINPFSCRHKGISLYKARQNGELPSLPQMIEMWDLARQKLSNAGYTQTSRSNFFRTKPNAYEALIADSAPRIALGPKAVGLVSDITYMNEQLDQGYNRSVRKRNLPIFSGLILDEEEQMHSWIVYKLLSMKIPRAEFQQKFGRDIVNEFSELVYMLNEEGLITTTDDEIVLTPRGVYYTSLLQRCFFSEPVKAMKAGVRK
jgi:oxygen-independent coproporphyrinogen-3 oxidase